MTDVGFVHLRIHSAYSLLAGMMKIPELIEAAQLDSQPALGIADIDNLFGALEFSEIAFESGIQPIIGCALEICLERDIDLISGKTHTASRPERVVLIASTEDGWHNLMKLVSDAYADRQDDWNPKVTLSSLAQLNSGIIALTGGINGPIDKCLRAGHVELARRRLRTLAAIFDNRLYMEIQRNKFSIEHANEAYLLELSDSLGLRAVATNETYFLHIDAYEAHEALKSISERNVLGNSTETVEKPEHYFKNRASMIELFSDLPEALENTIEIATRCSYRPLPRAPIIPKFPVTDSFTEFSRKQNDTRIHEQLEIVELRNWAVNGLHTRLNIRNCAPGKKIKDYEKRLNYELDIVKDMRFSGYFLIVADFIRWAKIQKIPVGPGRGSGAGSLIAWALMITDIDPLRFGLLFERFLNPERTSMPDLDIDFCQERRDEVIGYIKSKYGTKNVAHIITFGSLQAKAVLRDVGRVLQIPYWQVDRLVKLLPNTLPSTPSLKQLIDEEPKLQEAKLTNPIVEKLLNISMQLEGLYRHASTHAAGIVIGERALNELVPLYRDPRSETQVTQYNMQWVEKAGLIKFDFLGLKTLSVLHTACELVRKNGTDIDLAELPLDDVKTYNLLAEGQTVGVFQLESQGIRNAVKEIRPDRFEDIIALISLYRPGPIANISVYSARKHGREQPDYFHPLLEPVLKETHGIIVYQEQVMEIARVLAGYSFGEADLLRRAMGKKKQAEMDLQRSRFICGAIERGVSRNKSNEIFDLLAKFAGYGFNKSHAAAYALISYQTAYMKAHFPVEFIAALMTMDISNTNKLSDFRREAKRLGVPIEPPSINFSGPTFEVNDGKIIYSMLAIKGIGKQLVEHIVRVREERHFLDFTDFARRISPSYLNKRIMEKLIAAGLFDCFEPNRARITVGIDIIIATANRLHTDALSGQKSLLFDPVSESSQISFPLVEPWTQREQLKQEWQSIGFYLSTHPLDCYVPFINKMGIKLWSESTSNLDKEITFARLFGIITSRSVRKTKNENKVGLIHLDDPTGQYEVMLFAEKLDTYWDLANVGEPVVVYARIQKLTETISVHASKIEKLETFSKNRALAAVIVVHEVSALEALRSLLLTYGSGKSDVFLTLELGVAKKSAKVRLSGKWLITPQTVVALKEIHGIKDVQIL